MRDNAKCAGNGCPVRETCDRFVRPAVDGQEWGEPSVLFRRTQGLWPSRAEMICLDHVPLPVQPHGGASEEGDAC